MANDQDQVQHKHHGHHHKHKKHNAWKLILGVIVALIVIVGAIGGKFYFDAKKAVDSTYKTVKTQDKREGSVNLEKSQPFSVLLLGVDTGEYGRTYQGRSDTMMVAAIAPKKSTLVLSLGIPKLPLPIMVRITKLMLPMLTVTWLGLLTPYKTTLIFLLTTMSKWI